VARACAGHPSVLRRWERKLQKVGGVSAPDRGDAGKRVPVPESALNRQQTAHHESAKDVVGNVEEGWRSILRTLRITAYLRNVAECEWRGDHMVTQMLRQSDAEVFKLHGQAKLAMMREALARLDRQAAPNRQKGTLQ